MFDTYVAYWARQQPDALAIATLRSNVTYRQFEADIRRFATALNKLPLPQVGLAAVRMVNPYTHWLVLMALSRLGVASASLPGTERDAALLDVLEADVLLTDKAVNPDGIILSQEWIEQALRGEPEPVLPRECNPNAIGRVATSSGTTGRPKRVAYSCRDLEERARRRALLDISRRDVLLSTVGNDANFGFGFRLAGWVAGATVALAPPLAHLAAALPSLRPTFMVLSPAQLETLLATLSADARARPDLRLLVGGSTLSPQLARQARLRLAPDVQIAYSSTESGSIARGPASLLDTHPGAVGYALPWARIEVVDEAGAPCLAGTMGEVRVRSEEMVTGYHGDDEQSAVAFRDGWFHPGDLGVILPDGEIRIEGRIDDVMNLGGLKLLPSAVEEPLSSCPGVGDVAVFSARMPDGTEAPWAAIVRSGDLDGEALASILRKQLPTLPRLQVVWMDAIPRGGTGKVRREELRRRASEMMHARANAA